MNFIEYLTQDARNIAMKEGMREGMQKAKTETTQTVARNLLKQGLDIALIRTTTGLTTDEIKKLQA